jgi:hypothetical protein
LTAEHGVDQDEGIGVIPAYFHWMAWRIVSAGRT